MSQVLADGSVFDAVRVMLTFLRSSLRVNLIALVRRLIRIYTVSNNQENVRLSYLKNSRCINEHIIKTEVDVRLIDCKGGTNICVRQFSFIHLKCSLDQSNRYRTMWTDLDTVRIQFGESKYVVQDSFLMLGTQ